MEMDDDAAYLAFKARDARFDGRLFVGVLSTGIYCRPVCRVRTPMRKNCRFFNSRAKAEAADFRPCMKCRPEIAPGLSSMDSSRSLADTAAHRLELAVHHGERLRLPALAQRLGITERHLRRIFVAAHGVSPHDYLSTQRLLLAKQLLTDTRMPVLHVALASGFDSLRRFNAAFLQRYRFNPSQLRRSVADLSAAGLNATPAQAASTNPRASRAPSPALPATLKLAYRPPYDVAAVMAYFVQRQLPGVEVASGLRLARTVSWSHQGQRLAGWLQMQFVPERHEVHLSTSASLSPVLGAVLQSVRQMLDLDADPARIDPVLALLPVALRPGTRLPGVIDGFEAALRVILGQQVSVKAAHTLSSRLVSALGERLAEPAAGAAPGQLLTHLFPTAQAVAEASADTLGRLGIVRQRVRAMQALAQAVASGSLVLDRHAPLQATLQALLDLPGIGPWSAQLIAMRVLAWPDAWPASDIGLMHALGSRDPAQIERMGQAWRPWRAYAVMRLWHSLEEAKTARAEARLSQAELPRQPASQAPPKTTTQPGIKPGIKPRIKPSRKTIHKPSLKPSHNPDPARPTNLAAVSGPAHKNPQR